jgi:hypothetical protein
LLTERSSESAIDFNRSNISEVIRSDTTRVEVLGAERRVFLAMTDVYNIRTSLSKVYIRYEYLQIPL